jgi:hypothetical protein
MPAEVDELYQKTLGRGKGHIVPEPVAQRRRTSCPISRQGIARRANAIIRNGRRGATTSAAPARDAAYNSVLERRNTKITPCNADIAMRAARVDPIEAREDYPHISLYLGVLP